MSKLKKFLRGFQTAEEIIQHLERTGLFDFIEKSQKPLAPSPKELKPTVKQKKA